MTVILYLIDRAENIAQKILERTEQLLKDLTWAEINFSKNGQAYTF